MTDFFLAALHTPFVIHWSDLEQVSRWIPSLQWDLNPDLFETGLLLYAVNGDELPHLLNYIPNNWSVTLLGVKSRWKKPRRHIKLTQICCRNNYLSSTNMVTCVCACRQRGVQAQSRKSNKKLLHVCDKEQGSIIFSRLQCFNLSLEFRVTCENSKVNILEGAFGDDDKYTLHDLAFLKHSRFLPFTLHPFEGDKKNHMNLISVMHSSIVKLLSIDVTSCVACSFELPIGKKNKQKKSCEPSCHREKFNFQPN